MELWENNDGNLFLFFLGGGGGGAGGCEIEGN